MIRLYDYWRSSASYRLRIALNLMEEPWEAVPVNLLEREHKSPEHLARNPQGLVPVLEIDGHSFTQSLACLSYLDETRNLNLLPTDPAERARAMALAYAIAMEIHPVCNLGVAKHATTASNGAITMEGWMQHFITPGLAAFESMLQGGSYCFGNRLSMADLCLIPQLYNAERWGVDLTDMPKIRTIAAHLNTIPAFQNAHPNKAKPD